LQILETRLGKYLVIQGMK